MTQVRRIKLLGFNTIRLPFSMEDLFTLKPVNYRRSCPDFGPRKNPSPQGLLASVTMPGVSSKMSACFNATTRNPFARNAFESPSVE